MLYPLIRSLLFTLPPEEAHELTLKIAHLSPLLGKITGSASDPNLKLEVGSSHWSFPVGLAAGLDKNAEALPFFSQQGFGAIECGTLTLRPQAGNPKPRIFRYPEEKSLRNAMGFPNLGIENVLPRLRSFTKLIPLGVNIGQNKASSPVESIRELGEMVSRLAGLADYIAVNVSSPNTPGLRALQERSYLTELFTELKSRTKTDLYLKISPDLQTEKIIELTTLAADLKLTGLIATNTTILSERGAGGISGELLKKKSQGVQKLIFDQETQLEVIAVGGISRFADLVELWMMGGKAAQIYTSYIYQGPALLREMKEETQKLLKKKGIPKLQDFFNLGLQERRKILRES